jgi:DNA ligase-1
MTAPGVLEGAKATAVQGGAPAAVGANVTQSAGLGGAVAKQAAFGDLVEAFEHLEHTSSGSKMIDILAGLLSRLSPAEARQAAYLLKGKVSPDYEGPEFGMAEKFVLRVLAAADEVPPSRVAAALRKAGDLGDVAAQLAGRRPGARLSLDDVFTKLKQVALATGAGSQQGKIRRLAELLRQCSGPEARYVVRIVLGKLRLGVGEMTFLYGLSQALTGSKEAKPLLEGAFNVLSDLGAVAERALRSGVACLKDVKPVVGKPVRMMLAQRTRDLHEVSAHIPGLVHVEYKYDGERVQAHVFRKGAVLRYSRRLEDITHQYPDVVQAISQAFRGREAILEGEVVAIDSRSGKLQPFQVLMRRRRKYDVEDYVRKVPVKYYLLDLLYADGESLLRKPLAARKKALTRYVREGKAIAVAAYKATRKVADMEDFFEEATGWGAEGVMVKDAASPYEAGTRGWRWIKFKKEYRQELADTFDLVVVGAMHGRGRRAGTYGSLLVAAFDPRANRYESFTKVGAGFSDAELARLPKLLKPYRRPDKHRLVETALKADAWFEPALVTEVTGAQLTVSPVHAVARGRLKEGGLALRFPRFLRWREDKSPEQATTVQEIYNLYRRFRRG